MKSLNHWRNRKLFNEFAGPQGQVDPMGLAADPNAGGANMANDPNNPNLANSANATNMSNAANPVNAANSNAAVQERVPALLQRFLKALQQFNRAVQEMLMNKSRSAARRSVYGSFQSFRNAKSNFGKPTTPPATT